MDIKKKRVYTEEQKAAKKLYHLQYNAVNPGRRSKAARNLRARDPIHHLVSHAKARATSKGLPFDLTKEAVQALLDAQGGKCFYTGVPINMDFSIGQQGYKSILANPNKTSIDRVDSSKGYTMDNIVLCAARINLMKGEMSTEDFKKWCQLVK